MKLYLLTFLVLSFTLIISGCGNNANTSTDEPVQAEQPTPSEPAANGTNTLPAISGAEMQYLNDYCDFVDYIFYNLPISISLDQIGSIQTSLSHYSNNPATINPNCKAAGRVFFQRQGEMIIEAEFFFSDECSYYIFYQKGKQVATSQMTPAAIQFFNNNIQQVNQKLKEQQ